MEIYGSFSTNVEKALSEIDPDWRDYEGLIICGTHSPDELDPEELISKIQWAREAGVAYLGICFGHQLAAIEYARNALQMHDATSEEWGKGTFVVKKLPHLKVGLYEGESYWHNYEVDDFILNNWEKPWNFVTMQFHPEYNSRKGRPHPLLVKFLKSCGKQK